MFNMGLHFKFIYNPKNHNCDNLNYSLNCAFTHMTIFGLWKLVIGSIMIGFLVVHYILVFESFQILKKGMGLGIQMSSIDWGIVEWRKGINLPQE